MKTLITLLVLTPLMAMAQFNESFENKISFYDTWKIINNQNEGFYWEIYTSDNIAKNGKSCAMIIAKDNTQIGDCYLITPQIDVKENLTDGLSFWAKSVFKEDEQNLKKYSVFVSETGNNYNDFKKALIFNQTAKNEWEQITTSLKNYIGKKIYIAFSVVELKGGGIKIDDVINNAYTTLNTKKFDVNSYTMYPNPTTDVLNFTLNHHIKEISTYTTTGQKLETILTEGKTNHAINLSNYPKGMYLVKIKNKDGLEKTEKFIKN